VRQGVSVMLRGDAAVLGLSCGGGMPGHVDWQMGSIMGSIKVIKACDQVM
jgi:hypothetical protein